MVETSIELGGETHELKYPNSAVHKIDRKLGYSAMHLLEKAYETGAMAAFSMDDIATIIWGGMLHERPGLRVEQVVEQLPIKLREFGPYAEKVFSIVMEIYDLDGDVQVHSEEEDGEGNLPKAPGSGTGSEPSK